MTTENQTATEAEQPQLYTATLKEGQTYVFNGKTFEYNEAVTIDAREYSYLRTNAKKSVVVGSEGEQARMSVSYFEFKKVAKIVDAVKQEEDRLAEVPLLDDDDLEEVVISREQAEGNSALAAISEAPLDDDNGGAPGARSRARRAQK